MGKIEKTGGFHMTFHFGLREFLNMVAFGVAMAFFSMILICGAIILSFVLDEFKRKRVERKKSKA